MDILEIREQIQEDLITLLDDNVSDEIVTAACEIVVNNFNKLLDEE